MFGRLARRDGTKQLTREGDRTKGPRLTEHDFIQSGTHDKVCGSSCSKPNEMEMDDVNDPGTHINDVNDPAHTLMM